MLLSVLFRKLLFCCCFCVCFLSKAIYADESLEKQGITEQLKRSAKISETKTSDDVDTLPEVSVKDRKVEDPPFNSTQSISTVTSQELSRNQPSNIFEAVKSIPGVSVSGGPRPSGMTFSIRGYADNEDVMVKVDGVPKGFEKYRMGGTFVEPELLKSIEVQRGPQISSGSGSLGGTIIATTKNAEDFLKPGQKVGGKVKFGYGNNNDEYSRSYLVYARPDERIDILYNYSNRASNNITLASGSELANSAIESISNLLKVSVFPVEDLQLTTSVVKFEDTGLQQYDANSATPGFFGFVLRSIDDLTWSEALKYDPEHPWINLKASIGAGHTDLEDFSEPNNSGRWSSTLNPPAQPGCNGTVYTPNPANTTLCRGNGRDNYKYKTRTVDISNEAVFAEKGFFNISLLTGYQYNLSERDVTRLYDNPSFNPTGGFNPQVPPGTKSFHAIYIQPKFEIGQFSVIPGYRQDRYQVEADGGTLAILQSFGEKNKIKFKEETFSLGLAYDVFARNNPEKLTFYSNYGQGFRPPLVDEYFMQDGLSRCRPAIMPNGPASGICGDLFQPQYSESTEAGVSYVNPHLLGSSLFLSSKLNFFHIYTSNLFQSLRQQADGSITQEGWERRNGVEFETFMQLHGAYLRGSYSRTNGNIYNGRQEASLFTIPGNALSINMGAELGAAWDVNLTYRKISDRNILTSLPDAPFVLGIQEGYELWNAGVRWKANEHLTLRLIGENLKNEEYRLDGSLGGMGILAPGKNIKFFVELMY